MTTAVRWGDHHLTVLHRGDWGAGELRRGHRVPHSQFRGLVAHHTVTILTDWDGDGIVKGDLDDIAHHQKVLQTIRAADLGPEVPYSWTVYPHPDPRRAVICEGRGWGVTGAHTAGLNSTRYGVAYAGNTSTTPVTPGVLSAYQFLGSWLHDATRAAPTTGHRDHKATACPGDSLYAHLHLIQPGSFMFPVNTTEEPPMADEPSAWAAKDWEEAIRLGLLKGGNPQGALTREQGVTLLMNLQRHLGPTLLTTAIQAGQTKKGLAALAKRVTAVEQDGTDIQVDMDRLLERLVEVIQEGLDG